jgi:hypothetical protein
MTTRDLGGQPKVCDKCEEIPKPNRPIVVQIKHRVEIGIRRCFAKFPGKCQEIAKNTR